MAQLVELSHEGKILRALLPIRSVPVQHQFEISVSTQPGRTYMQSYLLPFPEGQRLRRQLSETIRKMERMLTAFLMLETLHPADTEMNQYLLDLNRLIKVARKGRRGRLEEVRDDESGSEQDSGG